MFEFNKRDRIGIITLAVVLVILVAVNTLQPLFIPEKKYDYSKYEALVTTQPATTNYNTGKPVSGVGLKDTVYNNIAAKQVDNAPAAVIVDINTADSLALLAVKGIGPTFAGRIVKYRNLLGGFTNKEQLAEVYGFADKYDGVKGQVKASPGHKRINLNTATFKEMNKHPYIKYELTKAIFNLKKKLGTFKAVDDIKQIDLVTDELYNKLAPYLTVQ